MRYLTVGLVVTAVAGAALWSAAAKADFVDINGPKVQHGLCLQSLQPGTPAGFGFLGPCPGAKKAAPARHRHRR